MCLLPVWQTHVKSYLMRIPAHTKDPKSAPLPLPDRVPQYNCQVQITGRILAIDYGARRMGLAVSDPLGITAQGLETMQRKNKRTDFAHLQRVITGYEVREVVLGLPLKMSGEHGPQSDKVTEFAEELRQRFNLPVHLWDERLTSAEANRVLREAELSIQKRARAVDRMAAVLILQSFMEARSQT